MGENSEDDKSGFEEEVDRELKVRPRSPTLLKLQWLAEKFRRSKNVETKVKSGAYQVDSQKLAKALINREE